MANEAVIMDLGPNGGAGYSFDCANSDTITKGEIMKLVDPRIASGSSADGDIFAGIAAADKVAGDGATTITLYTEGIFDLKADAGTISVGNMVKMSGANLIATADEAGAPLGQSEAVGIALQAATTGEVIAVKLRGF